MGAIRNGMRALTPFPWRPIFVQSPLCTKWDETCQVALAAGRVACLEWGVFGWRKPEISPAKEDKS